MQSSSVLSLSPNFNSYSSRTLAKIASRVVEEFRFESEFEDVFGFENQEKPKGIDQEQPEEEEENDEFEFPFVPVQLISADEIFCNGQIMPVFPIFGKDLLFRDIENGVGKVNSTKPPNTSSIRISLGKLMKDERDLQSCSSSESDELDGVPSETYCFWTPKSVAEAESPRIREKSRSTGSSKRWKFRNLFHRSNSTGRGSFIFLISSNAKKDAKVSAKESLMEKKVKRKVAGGR